MITILIVGLFAAIVFYALSKNYTVRAGGRALGTALFFEASKPASDPVDKTDPPAKQITT